MNDICITGLGIICSIGNDAPSVLESLKNRQSGIRDMKYLSSRHSYLPVGEVQLSDDQMKEALDIQDTTPISRTSLMGAIAIKEALKQAGVQSIEGRRVTLISGTTVGGMDLTEKYYEQMKTDDSLLFLPQGNECGKSTDEMAELVGLKGIETCTISTACSSALNSIIIGAEMLNFLKGPRPLSNHEISFLNDRFRDGQHVPFSYFKGAVPSSDYTPDEPFVITVETNPYSDANEGYKKLFIRSGGADNPREVVLRQRGSDGKWFLWDQFLLVGIRDPKSADPWA